MRYHSTATVLEKSRILTTPKLRDYVDQRVTECKLTQPLGKQFAIILWRWEFGCLPTQQSHMWVYVPQEPLCTRLKRVQGNVSCRRAYIIKRLERTRTSSVVNGYTDGGMFTPRKGLQLGKWQTAARCNNEISSTQRTLRAEVGEATRGQPAVSAGDVRSSGDSCRQSHRAFQDERKRTWWQISNEDCQGQSWVSGSCTWSSDITLWDMHTGGHGRSIHNGNLERVVRLATL